MTNDERNPKPECRKPRSGAFAAFVIRNSLFLRISSFVIRICEESFRESRTGFIDRTTAPSVHGAAGAGEELAKSARTAIPNHARPMRNRFIAAPVCFVHDLKRENFAPQRRPVSELRQSWGLDGVG